MSGNDINPTVPADSTGPATADDTGGMVPQDKVNKLEAKWRRDAEAATRKVAEYEAKLAEVENAKKSETEKAIEKARKEASDLTRKELEGIMLQKEIDAELKLRLQAQGYDPDLAYVVKGKGEIAGVDDIDGAIETALSGKTWASKPDAQPAPRLPMQGGAPTGRQTSSWNSARLESLMATGQTKSLTDADWAEIKAAQRSGTWR